MYFMNFSAGSSKQKQTKEKAFTNSFKILNTFLPNTQDKIESAAWHTYCVLRIRHVLCPSYKKKKK